VMAGQLATRGIPAPIQAGRRWVIERTHAWATSTANCAGVPSGAGWWWRSGWPWPAPSLSVAGWSAVPGPTIAGKAVLAAAHDHLPAQALSPPRSRVVQAVRLGGRSSAAVPAPVSGGPASMPRRDQGRPPRAVASWQRHGTAARLSGPHHSLSVATRGKPRLLPKAAPAGGPYWTGLILTMDRRRTAVLSAVSTGRAGPQVPQLWAQSRSWRTRPLLPRIEQAPSRGPGPRSDQAADACKSALRASKVRRSLRARRSR
jgi:hypothetical protein